MTNTKTLWRRWVWGIGIFTGFLIAAWRLENLATLLMLSFISAYVLNPLVCRLERIKFVKRPVATIITLISLLICFLALLFVVLPEVLHEFRLFMLRLPGYLASIKTTIVPWAQQEFGVTVPLSISEAMDQFGKEISSVTPKAVGWATSFAATVFGGTFSMVAKAAAVLMFPMFLFFLLKDYKVVVSTVDSLIPLRNKPTVHDLMFKIDRSLSAFLHGQFMVMLVLGTLYAVGYSVVGCPVALGVGLLTGLLCFIPYFGAATGFVLAVLLSLLAQKGAGTIAGVAIVFGAVQLLDAVLITPKIIGGQLGLSPLWIIVALMAGGELFGFFGILLAVPTTAVLKVLTTYTIKRYKASSIYRDSDSPPSAWIDKNLPEGKIAENPPLP
jgi:predicted PurR-regulated permease PerM